MKSLINKPAAIYVLLAILVLLTLGAIDERIYRECKARSMSTLYCVMQMK